MEEEVKEITQEVFKEVGRVVPESKESEKKDK
jgi:hypothetical protein